MSANVPELRFSGFADPWEQRKLGELGTTYGGLTGKTKNDFGHGDARFVLYTNVFDNPIADPSRLGLVEIDLGQNRVCYGDALFTVSSETPEEVGMSSVWLADLDNLYLNSFCFGYRQDGSFNPYYLAYMLRSKSVRESIELLAQGISRFNISKSKVMEVEVPVPTMGEQRQIGAIFNNLDGFIALHQRKHNQLSVLKGSLLEGMFPKPGSDVPELRFSGFADPWEQRKLGEVVAITMGQSPQGTSYTDNPNDAILVQGNADLKDGWVTPRVWTTEATKTAAAGSLIMSVRAPVGAMGKTRYDVVLGRGVAGLDGDEFLFQLLSKFEAEGYWFKVSVGSTFDSINGDDLRNAPIAYPHNASERVQIGEALGRLDSLIALHQRKLEKLRALKQSLLQKMFV